MCSICAGKVPADSVKPCLGKYLVPCADRKARRLLKAGKDNSDGGTRNSWSNSLHFVKLVNSKLCGNMGVGWMFKVKRYRKNDLLS